MYAKPLLIALACLPLWGCGMFSWFSSDMDLDEVKVHALLDANKNSATAVDIVLVLKKRCESQVSQLSAASWFQEKQQLLRDHPNCLTVRSWELAPGQKDEADIRADPVAAYAFALYTTRGDHRIQISSSLDTIHLILKRTDFVIREQEETE